MKEGSKNGVSPSIGGLSGEPGGGLLFTWDPEGYVKEGSGNRHLSPLGPCWGTRRGDQ